MLIWSNATGHHDPVRRHHPDRLSVPDLSAGTRRPALVVSTDNERRRDLVVAFITPVPRPEPDAVPIAPTPSDGLKVPSLVRCDKLATLDQGIIAGRLGTAESGWLSGSRNAFFAVFGFGYP